MSRVLCAISVLKLVAEKSFRKASILSAGPSQEWPGIEKSTVFQLKTFRKASILSAGPGRERPGIEESMVFN